MPHVGAALEEVRRAAVAQRVRRDADLEACRSRVQAHEVLNPLHVHASAAAVQEERALVRVLHQQRPRFPEVEVDARRPRGPTSGTTRSFLPLPLRTMRSALPRSASSTSSRSHSPTRIAVP